MNPLKSANFVMVIRVEYQHWHRNKNLYWFFVSNDTAQDDENDDNDDGGGLK